ncbi:MAG TPA: VWA domain-containing protein [Verrucomicrobiae bacterium]|nr:VWA domain-containing protein [Verrucomicrobiae bacterium]
MLASNAFPQGGYTPGMLHGPEDLGEPGQSVGVRFQPYEKTPLTFTSKPTYVLVPVVVINKEGKIVSGLKIEDFQVQENGKDQKVASLEEIKPSTAPLSRPAAPGNEITNQTSADVTPRRLVIIALDLLNTPFLDQTRARRALLDHLSESIEPDCLYQLLAIEDTGVRILHDYTQDTAALVAALKAVGTRFPANQTVDAETLRHISTDAGVTTIPAVPYDPKGAAGGGTPDSKALADFVAARAEQAYAQRKATDAVSSTLQAFLQIAQRASGLPGRKSLIWITGSFPFSIDPGTASVNEGLSFDAYQHTMQLLEQQLISVYPVDARGLVSTEPDASVHLNRRNDVFGIQQSRDASNRLLDTLNTMRAFADMTGGQAYVNTNDTRGAIHEAAQDGSDYYMLSYAVDKSNRRQGWRKISVKVGDYHIRARHGYFLTQTTLDPLTSTGYDMDNALKSPFDYTGLPLKVVLNSPVSEGDKRKVTFAMTMPPKSASVDSTDNNHLHVDIAYAVLTTTGQDAAHKGTSYDLKLNPGQLQSIETQGLGYGDTIELSPGVYQLRLVVRDDLTGQIGSVRAPLELK